MGCNNHPSEQDIAQIEHEANKQAEEVKDAAFGDRSIQQFAEKCAEEVEAYAKDLIRSAQNSDRPLSRSEVAHIEHQIQKFADEKAEEVREMSNRWKDPTPERSFESKIGRTLTDRVPDYNPNPDRDSIPGFHMGYYENPTGFGLIMKDENEPGKSTHVHYTKDGIILSTYNSERGTVDRFNLTQGKDWTGKGEGTEWPSG